jgi:cysteine desulfurase
MIYLDNNATTQVDPEVLKVVKCYLEEHWGNPNSNYSFGAKERLAIDNARNAVAQLINAEPSEIIFTSCATESNNMAFHSVIKAFSAKKHVIVSCVEHSSIMEICKSLEFNGYRITYLKVNEDGMINLKELEDSIAEDTCLVSLMWANNETGILFPVEEASKICHKKGVLFHCDAVQGVGKINIDLKKVNIDYLSISGHKIYAPKGVGALCIKNGNPIFPLIIGGGQEAGYRGGTYNTAFIVGLGKASELALSHVDFYCHNVEPLRDYFEDNILKLIPTVYFNGKNSCRLPNTSNLGIQGMDSDMIINYLEQYDIFISSGSACSSQAIAPSHVIQCMKGYDRASEALRISFSIYTTRTEVDSFLGFLERAYIALI